MRECLLCHFCHAPIAQVVADLGMSPLSNAYRRSEESRAMEPFYPLTAYVCERCFLVQTPVVEGPEHIFSDYAYFSSFSDTWLDHCREYCDQLRGRLSLGPQSQVIEIASNDGYLLQYFHAAGIPVLGIEPAANVSEAARNRGIETITQFFGVRTAIELAAAGRLADLLLGNNVLAHVPDINDFVSGLPILLKADGTITMEFPHLLQLIRGNQFDTIYHEHFSYLSLLTVTAIFKAHGLIIVDVEELPTHGGSLRIFAQKEGSSVGIAPSVAVLLAKERAFGLDRMETYNMFVDRVRRTKRALLEFLIRAKNEGKQIVAYGAPAKGNTLLNYCGIRGDFIDYTVDRSPHKQGRFLPGTGIPIYAPEKISETRPDYVLILPWNLRDEITRQMAHIREWGGRFVVPIPHVEVLD